MENYSHSEFFFPIPIPPQATRPWREIPIHECGEKLVSLGRLHPRIRAASQYYLRGIPGALADCLGREGLARHLVLALDFLPAGLSLVVWDAWRPVAVQASLFRDYKEALRREYPSLSEAALDEKTSVFVAPPSIDPKRPSPHLSGGAVDLTLADASFQPLNMGTDFDDFSKAARTAYFEDQSERGELPASRQEALQNRRLLFHAMTQAGFSNYPAEWWHFNYGNQSWASSTGQAAAIYGPAQ